MGYLRRLPSSPWQCMFISYRSCPSLMPVQAPGIRPPDVLHKDSAPVQGIEAFPRRVWSLLPFRRESAMRASACHVTALVIILRLTIWNDKFPVAPYTICSVRGERGVSIAWICAKFNVLLEGLLSRKRAPELYSTNRHFPHLTYLQRLRQSQVLKSNPKGLVHEDAVTNPWTLLLRRFPGWCCLF
jgi:hypothetical protein